MERSANTLRFRTAVLAESPAISRTVRKNILRGSYEREEIDIVLENVRDDDRVLELGASLGGLSSVVLREKPPSAYVCVEANPDMVALLRKNHALNGVRATTIVSGAVTREPHAAERDFYVHGDCWSSSLDAIPGGLPVRVWTYPFVQLLEEHRPTFLICDIEGGEYELLAEPCDLSGVSRICIELHGDDKDKRFGLLAFLMRQGFMEDERYRKHPLFGDVFFFKKAA